MHPTHENTHVVRGAVDAQQQSRWRHEQSDDHSRSVPSRELQLRSDRTQTTDSSSRKLPFTNEVLKMRKTFWEDLEWKSYELFCLFFFFFKSSPAKTTAKILPICQFRTKENIFGVKLWITAPNTQKSPPKKNPKEGATKMHIWPTTLWHEWCQTANHRNDALNNRPQTEPQLTVTARKKKKKSTKNVIFWPFQLTIWNSCSFESHKTGKILPL